MKNFIYLKQIKLIMDLAISQYKMTKCQLSKCSHSDRHFRIIDDDQTKAADNNNNDDLKYFNLYQETMNRYFAFSTRIY